jgi:dihydropteroate synthase
VPHARADSVRPVHPGPLRRVAGLPDPGRCLVMGVVNVTPDSFSDGGLWLEPEAAIEHGEALVADGADLVDVGGESTRPGADRPPEDEELRRVLPVISALASAGVVVSVDTMRAGVARAALDAGAVMVNDVSGGLADPDMLAVVAAAQVPYTVMHWRRHSVDMQAHVAYDDVVADVAAHLRGRLEAAERAGIDPDRTVVDPGLGFAKTAAHNWRLLAHLDVLHGLGRPLLLGASRKRFLGVLLADSTGERPATGRDDATVACSALAAAEGAWCLRVHEVRGSADAVRVVAAWAGEVSGP